MSKIVIPCDVMGTEHDVEFDTGTMVVRVYNEGGHNSVELNLLELLAFVQAQGAEVIDSRLGLGLRAADAPAARPPRPEGDPLDPVEQGWVDEITCRCSVTACREGDAHVALNAPKTQLLFAVTDEAFGNLCLQAVRGLVAEAIRRASTNRPSLVDVTGFSSSAWLFRRTGIAHVWMGTAEQLAKDQQPFVDLTMDRDTGRALYKELGYVFGPGGVAQTSKESP